MSDRCSLPCEAAQPAWRKDFMKKMSFILELEANWMGYREKAIDPRCCFCAVELTALLTPQGPAPTVVPISNGGVQVEWHDVRWSGGKSVNIEIELLPGRHVDACVFNGDQLLEEQVIVPGEASVAKWAVIARWFKRGEQNSADLSDQTPGRLASVAAGYLTDEQTLSQMYSRWYQAAEDTSERASRSATADQSGPTWTMHEIAQLMGWDDGVHSRHHAGKRL